MRPTSACRTGPSFGLAALLTTLVALGPLSTDLYLPALPTLVEVFRTDAARVQLSLSIFLVGFAVAQLAYGALSDRFGRRPVMLGGLALYFVASIGCAFASSIEMLIGVGEKRVQAKWDKAKSEAIEIQGEQNTTATKEVIVTETITETKYRDRIKEVIRYVPKPGTTCPADDEFVRLFNAD